jgi:hypothetical protein
MPTTSAAKQHQPAITSHRPLLEPNRNYPVQEAAAAIGCAAITVRRALDNGYLQCFRVGRRIIVNGQHLINWLNAGGKTGHGAKGGEADEE